MGRRKNEVEYLPHFDMMRRRVGGMASHRNYRAVVDQPGVASYDYVVVEINYDKKEGAYRPRLPIKQVGLVFPDIEFKHFRYLDVGVWIFTGTNTDVVEFLDAFADDMAGFKRCDVGQLHNCLSRARTDFVEAAASRAGKRRRY